MDVDSALVHDCRRPARAAADDGPVQVNRQVPTQRQHAARTIRAKVGEVVRRPHGDRLPRFVQRGRRTDVQVRPGARDLGIAGKRAAVEEPRVGAIRREFQHAVDRCSVNSVVAAEHQFGARRVLVDRPPLDGPAVHGPVARGGVERQRLARVVQRTHQVYRPAATRQSRQAHPRRRKRPAEIQRRVGHLDRAGVFPPAVKAHCRVGRADRPCCGVRPVVRRSVAQVQLRTGKHVHRVFVGELIVGIDV